MSPATCGDLGIAVLNLPTACSEAEDSLSYVPHMQQNASKGKGFISGGGGFMCIYVLFLIEFYKCVGQFLDEMQRD